MKKRLLSSVLSIALTLSLVPAAFAAENNGQAAAQQLYEMGLFQGTGVDESGNPIFDLDRTPTRAEAVTMLVRLLGKDEEATSGTWNTPFTDVADWAKPYVGYAYANGLTTGTSATTFGGNTTVNASQYLTFVLRALGYESGTDFQWDKAWELSDQIGLTNSEYDANTVNFTRGDVAVISRQGLDCKLKGSSTSLQDTFPVKAADIQLNQSALELEINETKLLTASIAPDNTTDKTVVWKSSNSSVATVTNGTVRGISKGIATITATTSNGLVASSTITVKGIDWYSEGEYRVGSDIPAGEYYAEQIENKSSGYYSIYTDTRKDKIAQNEIFRNYTFFTVSNGQLLSLSRCKITPASNMKNSVAKQENGSYVEGCYRVGVDIPAGEYKFTQSGNSSSGYYCIYSDISKEHIVNNDIFSGSAYCAVQAGEYLRVSRATFVCVEVASDSGTADADSDSITYAEVQSIQSILGSAYSSLKTASDYSKNELYNSLTIQYVSSARKKLDEIDTILSRYGTITITGNSDYSTLNDWFDDVYTAVSAVEDQDLDADGYSQYDFRSDVLAAAFAVANLRVGIAAILKNASN